MIPRTDGDPMHQLLIGSSQPVAWHGYLAWTALAVCVACSLAIAVDELALGYRQHMWIMNLVHPITALYLGPVWLWAYFTRGRRSLAPVGAPARRQPARSTRGRRPRRGEAPRARS